MPWNCVKQNVDSVLETAWLYLSIVFGIVSDTWYVPKFWLLWRLASFELFCWYELMMNLRADIQKWSLLDTKALQHCSNVWLKECTLISQTYWCPKDWTNEGGVISEKRRRAQVKKILHSSETFNFKPPRKRMAKLKCSTSCLHISPLFLTFSFHFSPNFPNDKSGLFPSPVNKRLQEHREGQGRLVLEWILAAPKCVIFWLHGFCVNQPVPCCGNVLETSHILTSRVCVC